MRHAVGAVWRLAAAVQSATRCPSDASRLYAVLESPLTAPSRSFVTTSMVWMQPELQEEPVSARVEDTSAPRKKRGGAHGNASAAMISMYEKMYELEKQDRMDEALRLFEDVLNEGFKVSEGGELPEAYRPSQLMVDLYVKCSRTQLRHVNFREGLGEQRMMQLMLTWLPRMGPHLKPGSMWFNACFFEIHRSMDVSPRDVRHLHEMMEAFEIQPALNDAITIVAFTSEEIGLQKSWDILSTALTSESSSSSGLGVPPEIKIRFCEHARMLAERCTEEYNFDLAFAILSRVLLVDCPARESEVIDIYSTILRYAAQADNDFHVDNSLRALIKPRNGVEVPAPWEGTQPADDIIESSPSTSQSFDSSDSQDGPRGIRMRYPKLSESLLLAALDHYARRALRRRTDESISSTIEMAVPTFQHLTRCLSKSSYHASEVYKALGHRFGQKPWHPPEVPHHLTVTPPAAYHALIQLLAYENQWSVVLDYIALLVAIHGTSQPSSVSAFRGLSGLVSALDQNGMRDMFKKLCERVEGDKQQQQQRSRPVHVCMLNVLLRALAQTGKVMHVGKLFDEISKMGLKPDVDSYNAVMEACVQANQIQPIRLIEQWMKQRGVKPDSITHEFRLRALVVIEAYDDLIMELTTMDAEGISPSPRVLRQAFLAADKADHLPARMRLVKELKNIGVAIPDTTPQALL